MKPAKILFIILTILIILIIIFVINKSPMINDAPIIGGDQDKYSCLSAAGYSYNLKLDACVREWELDDKQRDMAKVALETTNQPNLTVVKVEPLDCEDCYQIHLQDNQQNTKIIEILFGEIVKERQMCLIIEESTFRANETCEDNPVSGYPSECTDSICAINFKDSCNACTDTSIEYWTPGTCTW